MSIYGRIFAVVCLGLIAGCSSETVSSESALDVSRVEPEWAQSESAETQVAMAIKVLPFPDHGENQTAEEDESKSSSSSAKPFPDEVP